MPNHLLDTALAEVLPARRGHPDLRPAQRGRAPAEAAARGGDRARLPLGIGLEGLPGHRLRLRHPPARRLAPGRPPAGSRSSRPRPRPPVGDHDENIELRGMAAAVGADARGAGARATLAIYHWAAAHAARARHHHRRHQVRIRHRRERQTASHRRGADAGFVALLAGRRISGRHSTRRPTTSSSCATISRRWTGTRRPPGPALPAEVIAAPPRNMPKPCAGSPASGWTDGSGGLSHDQGLGRGRQRHDSA